MTTTPGAFGRLKIGICPWCGKVSYGGPRGATEAMEALRRMDPDGDLLRIYVCTGSGRWHFGHERKAPNATTPVQHPVVSAAEGPVPLHLPSDSPPPMEGQRPLPELRTGGRGAADAGLVA